MAPAIVVVPNYKSAAAVLGPVTHRYADRAEGAVCVSACFRSARGGGNAAILCFRHHPAAARKDETGFGRVMRGRRRGMPPHLIATGIADQPWRIP